MNTINLVGRLGNDPEVKENRTTFSIATNDGFGEKKKTNWHNCVVFGKLAEIVNNYAKKGENIAVQGSIDYYKTQEGKTFTSILVNNVTLLSSKQEAQY